MHSSALCIKRTFLTVKKFYIFLKFLKDLDSLVCFNDTVWKAEHCSKVAFHFKKYTWALSEFRIITVFLAVLPLSLHVCVFPTTYILQSFGSQNMRDGVCWDHYQQPAKNAKGKNFFSEWYFQYSNTTFSDYPLPCLAEAGASLCQRGFC